MIRSLVAAALILLAAPQARGTPGLTVCLPVWDEDAEDWTGEEYFCRPLTPHEDALFAQLEARADDYQWRRRGGRGPR